jgi:glycosyltransferase involved in cell wall biosynthesis/tetratricopeptide (TPR) repeat protein
MDHSEWIAELIPDGPGPTLSLGPRHANQLIEGIDVGPEPHRAIVLDHLVGRFTDPADVLRRIGEHLDERGTLIAVVGSRLNPRVRQGFSRREILDLFARAGYDVTACKLIPDPASQWSPLWSDGPGDRVVAMRAEDQVSLSIVVAGRRPSGPAPDCTAVLLDANDAPALDLSMQAEVITIGRRHPTELRSRAWNRAARAATGRYLAFLDSPLSSPGPWLERLLMALKSRPPAAAAGIFAMGFGTETIPCHNLPQPIRGESTGPVPALAGAGLVVERRAFVEMGGFDERLGEALDGPDICVRLRARGRELIHQPDPSLAADAVPTREATSGMRYFLLKWRGQIAAEPDEPAADVPKRKRSPAVPVLWSGPVLQPSGFGEEARDFVLALDEAGVEVMANPTEWVPAAQLTPAMASRLSELAVTEAPERFVNVVHTFPIARMTMGGSSGVFPMIEPFRGHPRAVRNIGWTMYETDRIPGMWVDSCNRMDEVWVPSNFNVETFSRAGVDKQKLHVVPGAVDTAEYNPGVRPLFIPEAGGFVFLSVFAWSKRKGWDALVRAYLAEFGPRDLVTLVLKVVPHWNSTWAEQMADYERFVRKVLGRDPSARPRIVILPDAMDAATMPRLYAAADAFVLASRGEAYGRPFLEAMATGLPTIATRCGGNVDFMSEENSYLVDTTQVNVPQEVMKEIPDYLGHKWAEPDVTQLRAAMRTVFEQRQDARAKGVAARRRVVAGHSRKAVARIIRARLAATGVRLASRSSVRSLAVTWEGPHEATFGLAEANREMTANLESRPGLEVKSSERADWQPWLTGRPPAVTVRHRWPAHLERPTFGKLVAFQPWEYGSIPKAWVEPMNRLADEVWVPTEYVRQCFVRSGVAAGKLAIVPYGVDPSRFRPDAPPIALPTGKKFRFLFVGGTIARKGADILLETYLRTFGPADDVCLVIKDMGTRSFYGGQGLGDSIRAAQADPAAAEIVYLEDDLPASDMPGLYTACQCLVHPYRGEGFGLPIAEAMACGLAVIVPRHGACLDFCDDSVAMMVRADELRLPAARVGAIETVEPGWWAEVDRDALASAMREVVAHPQEAAALGSRASERVRTRVTWQVAAGVAEARLNAVAARRERISVCVVAMDEERSLRRCLGSLAGVADELIVVDTGSSDGTVEIARSHGATIVETGWTSDFAAARNEALRHATGAWVLMLDADEWLDAAGRDEIRLLVPSVAASAYSIRQRTCSTSNPEGIEMLRLRLFRNDPGLSWIGTGSERLIDSAGTVLAAVPCGVVVHHDGSPQSRRRRVRRKLDALVKAVDGNPDDPRLSLELAYAYVELERHAEAESAAARAAEAFKWRPGPAAYGNVRACALWLRARALLGMGDVAAARDSAEQAARLDPELAGAFSVLGDALDSEGRLEDAASAYGSALTCMPIASGVPLDRADAGWRSLAKLAKVEGRLGRLEAASGHLEAARRIAPRALEVKK